MPSLFGTLGSLTDWFNDAAQQPRPTTPARPGSPRPTTPPRRKSFLEELDDELNQPDELDKQEPDDFLKRLDDNLNEPDELPAKRYTSPFSMEPSPATSRPAEPFRLPGTTPTGPLATTAPQAPFTPTKPPVTPPPVTPPPVAATPAAPPLGAPKKPSFEEWYTLRALNYGLNPDPDAPEQFYDYRAAYKAGAEPDATGHWPSQFKKPGHPDEVVGGFSTITGQRVPGTKREGVGYLIEHGWDPATAKQLAKLPEPKADETTTPKSRFGLPQTPAETAAPPAVMPPPDERTPAQFTSALDRVMQRMDDAGYPMKVTSTQRTAEQQKKLFAQGRSAPGPIVTEVDGVIKKSLHQSGIAADLTFKGEKKPWDLLGKIAKEEGLVWGGDWKTLKDYGHVQLGTALPPSAIPPMAPMAAHEPGAPPTRAAATPGLPPMQPVMAHEKTKEEAKIGAAPQLDPLNTFDFLSGLFERDPATGVPILSKKGQTYIPFVGSMAEAADYADIWRAAVRVQHNEGTPADDKILRDFQDRDLEEARRGTSWDYKVASTIAGLIPFGVEFAATSGAYTWAKTVTREGQEALIRQVIKESVEKAAARVAEKAVVKGVKAEAVEMAKGVVPWAVGSVAQTAANVPRLAAATGERLVPDLSPKPLSHEDQQAADQLDAIGTMVDSYKPQVEAATVLRADLDTYNSAQQAFAPRDAQMQAAVTTHDAKVGALNAEMSRLGQGLEDEQNRFEQRVDAWKRRGSPNSEVALINAQQSQLKIHIDAFNRRQEEVRQEAAQARNELDQVRVPYEQEFNALKAQGAALEPRIAAATKTEQELAKLQKQAEPLQRRLTKAQSQDLHTILKDYHDDFLGSFGKAFADQLVETASERTGEVPGELFGLLGKTKAGQAVAGSAVGRAVTAGAERVAGLKAAVLDRWLRLNPKNTLGKFLEMAKEGTAWSSAIGEIAEERIGEVMRKAQPWLNVPGQPDPAMIRIATGEARQPQQGETAADLSSSPRYQAVKDLLSQLSVEAAAFQAPSFGARVLEAIPFGKAPEDFSVKGATLDQLNELRQGLQVVRQSLTVPEHIEAMDERIAKVDARLSELGQERRPQPEAGAELAPPSPPSPPPAPGGETPGPEFAPVTETPPAPPPVDETGRPLGGEVAEPPIPTIQPPTTPIEQPPFVQTSAAARENREMEAAREAASQQPAALPEAPPAVQPVAPAAPTLTSGTTSEDRARNRAAAKAMTEGEAEAVADAQHAAAKLYLEGLPDYAVRAVRDTSLGRRTNEGGTAYAPDPYAGGRFVEQEVRIADLLANPRNKGLGTKEFGHRGAVTQGPIVIDDRGEVIDGNNRTHEAIGRGDATIQAYVFTPAAAAPATTPSVQPATEGPQWRVPQQAQRFNPFMGGRAVLDPASALNRTLRDQSNRLKALAQLRDWMGRPQNKSKQAKQTKWAAQVQEIQQEYEKDWGLVDQHLVGVDVPALRQQIEAGETPQFPEMTFAERKGEPGGRQRRNAIGSYALEDALSPVAQRALDAMFRDYTAGRQLRHVREAMEVYQRLLDQGDKPALKIAARLASAMEKLFTDAGPARDVSEAAYAGLQEITGEESPDWNNELLENQIFADPREQGQLIFDTLDPKTGTFDIGEFNTAFGTIEFQRNPQEVFPPPATTVDADKHAGPTISQEQANATIEAWKAAAKEVGRTEDNSNKIIISLFDVSGVIAQPWIDAGYTVLQYDIKNKKDLTNFGSWMGEVQDHIDEGREIVGILAQPPCTSFARISGAQWWKTQHDIPSESMVAKKYGLWAAKEFDTPLEYANTLVAVVKLAVAQANPGWYVMENPVGRIDQQNNLPKPTLVFDPNTYGEPYTKQTQLWGEFNTNLPTAHVEATEGSKIHKLRGDIEADKAERSVTPTGFAYSFFMANHPSAEAALGKPAPAESAPPVSRVIAKAPTEETADELTDRIMREAPAAVASRYRMDFGRATFRAIQAMLSPRRDDLDMKHPEDVSIARAAIKFLDAMTLGKGEKAGGRVDVHLTHAEAMLLADEFEHLGTTPALLPEFEDKSRNRHVRLAFQNAADKLRLPGQPAVTGVTSRPAVSQATTPAAAEPTKKKEAPRAAQSRKKPESDQPKHPGDGGVRAPTEAGGGGGVVERPTAPESEAPQVEPWTLTLAQFRTDPRAQIVPKKSVLAAKPAAVESGKALEGRSHEELQQLAIAIGLAHTATKKQLTERIPRLYKLRRTLQDANVDDIAQYPRDELLKMMRLTKHKKMSYASRQGLAAALVNWAKQKEAEGELARAYAIHWLAVRRALVAGETVPQTVLKDHPDLVKEFNLGEIDTGIPAGADSPSGRTPAEPSEADSGDRGAGAEGGRPGKRGRTGAQKARPSFIARFADTTYRDTVLPDAQQQGYDGDLDKLRRIYDDRVRAAREYLEDKQQITNKHSGAALLAAIRGYGGLRPFELLIIQGAPTHKLRGEFASMVEGFRGQGIFGSRSIFRNSGLGVDEILDRLHQNGEWAEIEDDRMLMDRLDDLSRGLEDYMDVSEDEIDGAIRAAGVVLGEPWWQDFDQSMNFDVDTLAEPTTTDTYLVVRYPPKGSKAGTWYAGTVDRVGADWVTSAGQAKQLTKAEVAQIAETTDVEGSDIRIYRNGDYHDKIEWNEVRGYVGHDPDTDTAIYDPAKAWKNQPSEPTTTDTLDTGEEQPRLPGAEGARQAGKAPTTFKAPQQATAGDFTLAGEATPEAAAREAEAEAAKEPDLFAGATPTVPPAPETSDQLTDRILATLGAEPPGAPERRDAILFRSGNQRDKAALAGYMQAGVPVGVVALKENGDPIDGDVRRMIVEYAQAGGHVFVDSGVVGNPDIDFDNVMGAYASIAIEIGEDAAKHLYIVAPDMPGDAEQSRMLQAQYQNQIRAFIEAGLQVIVPIQVGEGMAQHAADTIAQFPGLRIGIPSARAAITLERLQDLLDTIGYSHGEYIKGVHFLGLSELNKKFDGFAAAVRAALPHADITADASRTSSMMRTGRPVHTEVKQRTESRADELIDAQADADTTEMAGDFFRGNFDAFTPTELKKLADSLNISVAQLKKEAAGEGGVQAAVDATGLEDALFQKFYDVAKARMTRQEGPKARTEVIAETQKPQPPKSRPPVSLPTQRAKAEPPTPPPAEPAAAPLTEENAADRLIRKLKERKEREKQQPPKPPDVLYQDDEAPKTLNREDVKEMVDIVDELRAAGVTDFGEVVQRFQSVFGEGARDLDAAMEMAWQARAGEARKVSEVLPPAAPKAAPTPAQTPEPELKKEAPPAPAPAPAPMLSAAHRKLGEETVGFGKHSGVLIKDLYAKFPGYIDTWLMDHHEFARARLVVDYVRHQPEYIAAHQQASGAAQAALTEDVVKALTRLRITAEAQANGTIALGGKTYDHRDILKSPEIGGRGVKNPDGSFTWFVRADRVAGLVDRIRGRVTDGRRSDLRRPNYESNPDLSRLRSIADEWPDGSQLPDGGQSFRSKRTEELINRGRAIGVPQFVLDEQAEDVSRINAAYQGGKPLFVLASEPGSGKTFVLGGAIRELRAAGAQRITYVTMNQDLVSQIKEDLKDFEIGDVQFITYTALRGFEPEATDVLIFDESQSIKNPESQQGKRAAQWIALAKFTIASSATPFENPAEAQYLDETGVFQKPFGTAAEDYADSFLRFATAFGATPVQFKLPSGRTLTRIEWWRSATSDADGAAARQWLWRHGVFTSRQIRLPDDQVDARLVPIQAPSEHAERYRLLLQAAKDEEGGLEGFAKAWIKNFQKRLLEASKVEHGITEARSALHRGRFPIIFVETKAERTIPIKEWQEKEIEYARAVGIARMMGDTAPQRSDPEFKLPPAGVTDVLVRYMELSGKDTIEIPSAEDLIEEAFGKDQVAIYTGSVSPEKAKKNLDEWRAGKRPVLVATMAKGGTGLSLHDKIGNHQTTQININMPWTATGIVQVSQRSARYGLKGRAELMWVFADNIPMDAELGRRVGGRMADMGAVIHGERLRGSAQIENADYDDMGFAETHEALQATGEAAVPFDAESLERVMGLPPEQADSVVALRQAMAMQPEQVGGKAIGLRRGGVPGPGALTHPSLAVVQDRWNRTRLVSVADAALALGNEIPGYVQAVGEFILQQRDRLLTGRMTPRDVAKAYLLTLGSIRASGINLDTFIRKTGLRPTPDFITVENGTEQVRPEHAVAYWMFTAVGQRALDNVEHGRINERLWRSLLRVRDAYGANTIRANAFKQTPGTWSMHDMVEATHAINAARGDSAAIGEAVKKLAGIGEGKEGFIKFLLGIGDTPTVDSVEVNFWLTGKGTTRGLDTVRAQLAEKVKTIALKSPTAGPEITARIQRQIGRLAERMGMEPTTAAALLHHALWDMSRGTETTHVGLMKAMTLAQAGDPLPTETEAFKRYFGKSQVVDVDGNPLRVYHGTRRLDRIGSRFLKGRATSGPMSFFTDNPELASKYALSKPDTSYEQPDDYAGWFQYRVGRSYVPIDRAWYFLSPEQRANVAELLPQVTHLDKDGKELHDYRQSGDPNETGLAGRDHWDYEIQQAKGNVLRAAVEVWLSSGGIFDAEEDFMRILELGGMPMEGVRFESPWKERPGVVPVYLSIQKPLDTTEIPATVVDALQRASRGRRRPAMGGADFWAKTNRDAKGWMDELREDIKTGRNPHAWTSIPDWVTKTLKTLGYDGISDRSGKLSGDTHAVWIPFEPTQIKSAISNRGTYDPRKPNILYQQDQPVFYSRLTRAVEAAKQNRATGAQWKGIIRNAKTGISQDEYVYASVDDLENGKTYTKQEVLDYLEANGLAVQTVGFGGLSDVDIAAIGARLDRAGYMVDGDPGRHETVSLIPVDPNGIPEADPVAMQLWNGDFHLMGEWAERAPNEGVLQDFKDYVSSSNVGLSPPRFAQYTEAGADVGSQREVFLTMPSGLRPADEKEAAALRQEYTQIGADLKANHERMTHQEIIEKDDRQAAITKRLEDLTVGWKDGHPTYDDIINPIVRVRYNVRTRPSYTVARVMAIAETIRRTIGAKTLDSIASGGPDAAVRKGTITQKEAAQYSHWRGFNLNDQTGALEQVMFIEEVQPPSEAEQQKMPKLLVKNWRELAFKWALRIAAHQGYSAVAWTSGAMQARRYSLEKAVKSIKWGPVTAGGPSAERGGQQFVVIEPRQAGQGAHIRLLLDGEGTVIKAPALRDSVYEGKALGDIVGKEVAERITSTHIGELSGQGLAIGGIGLKQLYDVDFPRVVNNLPAVKKAGARVGTHELQFGTGWGQLAQTRQQEGFAPVPAIDMTGDLRQALLGPQPLFQGPRAAVDFQSHGYDALVHALENPNVSSAVHELAHISRRWLFDLDIPRDQRRGISDKDILTAAMWAGAERDKDGKIVWSEAAEEKFANGFERYLRDGQAPIPELRELFRKFAQWLKDIYQEIFQTRLDLELTPAMREVYDHLVIRSMTIQSREGESEAAPAVSRPAVSRPAVSPKQQPPTTVLFQRDDTPGEKGTEIYGFVEPVSASIALTRRAWNAANKRKTIKPLVEFEAPEAEARYQTAHGIRGEGAWDKVGRFKENLKKVTRHFPELNPSESPFHAMAMDLLLDYERAPEWAQLVAHNRIAGFVKDLAPDELDLFARAMILPDILLDHEKGLYDGTPVDEMPYELSRAQVQREIERVNAVVAEHPKVQEALARRAEFVKQLTQELVDAELLPADTVTDKAYYHRQVMAYYQPPPPGEPETGPVVTKGQGLRQRKRGFQWTRSGGGDFNTNYIQSEYEWVAQALKELKTKETTEKLKAIFDRSRPLKQLAKDANFRALGIKLVREAKTVRSGPALAHERWRTVQPGPAEVNAKLQELDEIRDGPTLANEALKPWKRAKAQAIENLLEALASEQYVVSPGYVPVVEELAERYKTWLVDNEDVAPEDREPFDSNHPQWWGLLKDLVQHSSLAAKWAATFIRAHAAEEDYIKESLGDAYLDRRSPDDLLSLADPGHTKHQPDPGNLFYRATSIDDKLFDAVVAGSKTLTPEDKRKVLAMGGPKETWIIPKWLKATMDQIGASKTEGPLTKIDDGWKSALGAWKQVALLAPTRILKYNLNNFMGDADAIAGYAPGIFIGVPMAVKFLRNPAANQAEVERLVQLGVMNAGLSHVELPELMSDPEFRRFAEESPKDFMIRQLTFGGTYWEKTRAMTEWRENVLRVAAYNYMLEEVKAGTRVYAASNATRVDTMRAEIDAAKTPAQKAAAEERLAALLARELVGDYRAVSVATTQARTRALPFFSFQEINMRRYVQLFKNAGREERGRQAARLARTGAAVATGMAARTAVRVAMAYAIKVAMVHMFMLAVSAWNHFLFPDETEEMRRRGRQQLHLILGRWGDGSVRSLRIEGAFSDFLEWVGGQNYIEDIWALTHGDITGVEKLKEMGKAPINKLVQAYEPFLKMAAEQFAGKRTFPDVWRPTPIRDRAEHLAGLFALDGLYSRVMGKPQTGNLLSLDTLKRTLLFSTDPGEAAYFDTRENVVKYLEKHHKETPGMEPTKRQNALFYYKKAIQWGDDKAAQKWFLEYRTLAGDKKPLKPNEAKDAIAASVAASAPLGMLSFERQREFRKSLTPRERASLAMADAWYRRTYGRDAIRRAQ